MGLDPRTPASNQATLRRAGIGAAMQDVSESNRPPETAMALEQLGHRSEDLSNALLRLADRLAPVVRPSGPTPERESRVEKPAFSTAIASQINEQADVIGRLAIVVIDLTQRLEV